VADARLRAVRVAATVKIRRVWREVGIKTLQEPIRPACGKCFCAMSKGFQLLLLLSLLHADLRQGACADKV
jgi:hypothetical protein